VVPTPESPRASQDRELPRGPHSLSREEVLGNQRQRLLAAMTAAVGEQGYAKTTVADVIAIAGVSRKAFYEHFANREECFLETYDTIVAEGIERVALAYRSASSRSAAITAGIEALFTRAIQNPQEVRIVLVEIGAVGPAGAERREQLLGAYEQLLRESVKLEPGPGTIPNPILRAIVGGITHVLYSWVRVGRERRLKKIVPDLVSWVISYYPAPEAILTLRDPQPKRPFAGLVGGRAPGSLSPPTQSSSKRRGLRGEHVGSHSFVIHSQRERILDAVANLSASKGYAAVTVKDIAEQAAVSLDAFYEHYQGKEDAFLVAYEVGHAKGLTIVEHAYDVARDWRSAIGAAVAALFDFLASEPAFAYLALVDARVATERTAERASRGVSAYAQLLMPGFESARGKANGPPAVAVEAIVGGIFELCISYTLQNRAEALSELVPRATYFALAPFLGAETAGRLATDITG
jgi:AcrR family transcriptional regulator